MILLRNVTVDVPLGQIDRFDVVSNRVSVRSWNFFSWEGRFYSVKAKFRDSRYSA